MKRRQALCRKQNPKKPKSNAERSHLNRIKIYRGRNQIGGVVTEFRKGDHRILVDFGASLPGSKGDGISDDKLLDEVFGGDNSSVITDAVLFTHYHGDHVGLKNLIPNDIPMYIGKTAKEIMTIIAKRVDHVKKKNGRHEDIEMPVIERMQPYWEDTRDFSGIKVTPYLCDHSAIDSYMFVIELNGKKILYTGDFRDHGVPGEKSFEDLVKNQIGKVDILVTEGTMILRSEAEKTNPIQSEEQLREKAEIIFKEHHENVVLVSSTNLDSVMNFYLATPLEKAFVCDLYQAEIMKVAIESRHDDFPETYRYKKTIYVLCPDDQKILMRDLEDIKNPYNHKRAFFPADPEKYQAKGFVMLARPNRNPYFKTGRFEELMNKMRNPYIIYSLWKGYLWDEKAKDPRIIKFMEGHMDKKHFEPLHTSGHAYIETLKKLMDMSRPDLVMPMHTESVEAFSERTEFKDYKIHDYPEYIIPDDTKASHF